MKCFLKWAVPSVVVLMGFIFWYRYSSSWVQWSHQPLQYLPNMHRTESLKPQRGYDFFENFSAARIPPAGSVAREQNPTVYVGASVRAEDVAKTSAPLAVSRELLLRGQFVYNNNCIVCHGRDGNGNGSIVGAFPNPPSLNSEKIRGFADSQIFHIITNGQNTMGAYGPQIRESDRWAVVKFVRVLHLASAPSDEDLRAFEAVLKGANP